MDLVDFVASLSVTGDRAELARLIPLFIRDVGLEYFLVVNASLGVAEGAGSGVLMTNFPSDLIESCKKLDYSGRAAIYRECLRASLPLDFKELKSRELPAGSLRLLRGAERRGLGSGAALAISGPGGGQFGFFFASRAAKLDTRSLAVLRVASFAILMSLVELRPEAERRAVRLTEREREILSLIAEGKTKREAAELLEVSEASVKRHCESLFEKLGANNLASAVSKAMGLSLICPEPAPLQR